MRVPDLILAMIFDGLAYSMVLFMIAAGLSISLGLMRVVNLAHGACAMAGGLVTAVLMSRGLNFELALAGAVCVTAAIAAGLELTIFRRIYTRDPLDQSLVTIGITFIAVALANLLAGNGVTSLRLPEYLTGSIDLGFRTVPARSLAIIALGVAMASALWIGIERSRFGIRLRACVDDADTAQSIGINARLLYTISFALGGGLAALGGVVGSELLPLEPTYALKYIVLFLAVVAVGGHGTLLGSFLAALLLGMTDTVAKYLVPDLSYIAFFATMLIVLTVKPQGLLGKV
jgi:branched-chain amino acid transport system permease protein